MGNYLVHIITKKANALSCENPQTHGERLLLQYTLIFVAHLSHSTSSELEKSCKRLNSYLKIIRNSC